MTARLSKGPIGSTFRVCVPRKLSPGNWKLETGNCVYINPTRFTNFDCEVYLWVKDSEVELDQALLESVDRWLQEEWPFKQRAYPGRSIDFASIVSIPL
jgi:hypothetical protein